MAYRKLDPAFKKQWLAALRSGDYDQARGALREVDHITKAAAYCCLGVACDLIDSTGWEVAASSSDLFGWNGKDYSTDELPFCSVGVARRLAELNDSEDLPADEMRDFNDIADWIEAHL